MSLKGTCPGSHGVPFKSTLVLDNSALPWQGDSYRHINSQPEYINYSAEELRWEDYRQKEDLQAYANGPSYDPVTIEDDKSQLPCGDSCQKEDLQDNDNGSLHEPFTLEDDEAPKKPVVRLPPVKPVVCLPSATAGVSYSTAVVQLQNEIDELKLRSAKLEQGLAAEKASVAQLKWQMNGMKLREEMTNSSSDKRVKEARDLGRTEALKESMAIREKLAAEYDEKFKEARKQAEQTQDKLCAKYVEKLKTVQKEADMAKSQAVVLEEKSALTVETNRQRLWEARDMVELVGKAARNNPATRVGDVWKEVLQFKKHLADQRSCLKTTNTTVEEIGGSTSQQSMSQCPMKKDPDISGFDTSGGQQMRTPKGFSGYAFSSTWKGLPSNELNSQTPWSQGRIEGMAATLRQRSQDQECAEPVELGKRPRDSEAGVNGGEEKRRKLL
jgi:hypothetical protein